MLIYEAIDASRGHSNNQQATAEIYTLDCAISFTNYYALFDAPRSSGHLRGIEYAAMQLTR